MGKKYQKVKKKQPRNRANAILKGFGRKKTQWAKGGAWEKKKKGKTQKKTEATHGPKTTNPKPEKCWKRTVRRRERKKKKKSRKGHSTAEVGSRKPGQWGDTAKSKWTKN